MIIKARIDTNRQILTKIDTYVMVIFIKFGMTLRRSNNELL